MGLRTISWSWSLGTRLRLLDEIHPLADEKPREPQTFAGRHLWKRKVNKIKIAVGASTITFLLCFFLNHFVPEHKSMTKVHKLEYPLMLSSDSPSKNTHMLPAGTVLYFDKSYPEGFTRYKVYINIDRIPLKLDDLNDATEISPIDAVAPSKDDLLKLLRDYPLTKSDFESILNSKRISKEEIREILAEYSR